MTILDVGGPTSIVGALVLVAGLVFLVTGVSGRGIIHFGNAKVDGPIGLCVILVGAAIFLAPLWLAKGSNTDPLDSKKPSNQQTATETKAEKDCSDNKTSGANSPVICGNSRDVTINGNRGL